MGLPTEIVGAQRPADAEKRPFYRSPFLWAGVTGILTITVLRLTLVRIPEPPPKIGQIPDFTLVSQDGKPFGSRDLRGKVYVVNFIFTSCASVCPKLTQAMRQLQARFKRVGVTDLHLISITVDPETDTPARLRAYAKNHGADTTNWTFLTGGRDKVTTLIMRGFKQHVGKKEKVGNIIDIAHTQRFAIIDRDGGLRGFYKTDALGLDEIFHRSRHVLKLRRKE